MIFISKEPKNGKITLEEKEFKELIEKAYNDGYEDGKNSLWYINTGTTSWPPYPQVTYSDKTAPTPYKYEVTC